MLLGFVSCGGKAEEPQLGSIYGEVTDKTTGNPIANAGVELQPSGDKATTGSDGHFEFSNVSEGTYSLIVSKSGYNRYESQISVGSEENKRNDVQLEKALTSLVVVDDQQHEVSTIDFGTNAGTNMRSITLVNKSDKAIEWEIKHESAAWIQSINPSNGSLNVNGTQSVTITIDRTQLPNTENSALIHISSAEGSKDITIKAGRWEVVETVECSNITGTTAVLNGKLNDNVNGSIYRYGFVYATYPNFLDVDHSSSYTNVESFYGKNIGAFTYKAENLDKNKTYYVRAYAQTSDKVYYGKTLQFTTTDGVINYYIKHPWNGGEWMWQKMTQEGSNYTYTGLWGGEGANINTSANDADAKWFPANVIDGTMYIYGIGFKTKFTYNPQNETLSVEEVGNSY